MVATQPSTSGSRGLVRLDYRLNAADGLEIKLTMITMIYDVVGWAALFAEDRSHTLVTR